MLLSQAKAGYAYMGLHFFIIPLFGLLIFNFHNMKYGPMKNSFAINYLGKISYSFYMWQFIAIAYGKYLSENYTINSWYVMLIALSINIILSSISYHLIEEKFRRVLIKKIGIKK